jgi:hypothetical protein
MRRFYDTTAPTKEGLLRDNKIVSNLHDRNQWPGLPQVCGKCQIHPTAAVGLTLVSSDTGTLGINGIRLYGDAALPVTEPGAAVVCRSLYPR